MKKRIVKIYFSKLVTESLNKYEKGLRKHKLTKRLDVLIEFGTRKKDDPHGKLSFTIPAGFVTDFASIPRALRWLCDNDGPWAEACVVHDFLYSRNAGINRLTADTILFLLMYNHGINFFVCCMFWIMTRVFGWTRKGKK